MPRPFVADEFSYLLGAETFAAGHLTNPIHPMWEHFETLRELVRPTYMTMYPPGQSLFLALGLKLFGHPWFGVLISFGLFAGCLCWMLQNWLPPIYALLASAVLLARISLFGYWMNSYWGGAVAAAGGCLVLARLPSLARRAKVKDVIIASIGLVVLANTRPFEGLVIAVGGVAALLWWRRRLHRPFGELLTLRCLLPLLLICGAVGTLDCYYNYRVTGHASLMPYAVYFRDYRIAPPWLVLSERPMPVYRHANLENTWEDDLEKFRRIKSHPAQNLADLRVTASFFVSALCLFPMLIGLLLSRSYRLWTAAFLCACLCGTLLITMSKTPHYVAGGAGALGVIVAYGLRWLRAAAEDYGPLLVLTLVALLCLEGRAPDKGESWQVRSRDTVSPRTIAMKAVGSGKHLIFVRYSLDHIDKSSEVIFNHANIDDSEIVWAHDMGRSENKELLNYYHGTRKAWLFQPDATPQELVPYESADQYIPATGRTYATGFPATENPISEKASWVSSASAIRTTPGVAFGTQSGSPPPPYLDSAALLTGTWGSDQFVQITVHWNGAPGTNQDYDEVEIRLRGTLGKNWDRTYNINCRVGTPSRDSYIQMGRANGPPDDFTPPLAELHGSTAACQDGDVVTGTIVGSVITAYINGKKVIQGTDSVITSGAPGFGFFHQGTHSQNSDFGISSFIASDRLPRFDVQGQAASPARPKPDGLK